MLIYFKIILFVLNVFPSVDIDEWKSFTSDEGGFSVLTPGTFESKEKTIKTELGEMLCGSFIYQDTMGLSKNELYVISYCDYPEGTFHKDSTELIDEVLEVAVEQENANLKGQVTYNHKIKQNGYPGRIFRIRYNNSEVVLKSKVFLVNDRFFTIQVYTLYKYNLNFNIDKFFNSFRLLN
jgi:hypothetical protein